MKVYVCWISWYNRFNRDEEYQGDDQVDIVTVFSDKEQAKKWKAEQDEKALQKEKDRDTYEPWHESKINFGRISEFELDRWVDPDSI